MADIPPSIREHEAGLDISVHVQPRARKTEWAGWFNGALKLKIAAPPVDDAANCAVVDYFARSLDLPRSSIRVLSGHKSRNKVVRISNLTAKALVSRLKRFGNYTTI